MQIDPQHFLLVYSCLLVYILRTMSPLMQTLISKPPSTNVNIAPRDVPTSRQQDSMRSIAREPSSEHLVVDKDSCCMTDYSNLASDGTRMHLQTLSIRASRRVVVLSPGPRTRLVGGDMASGAALHDVSSVIISFFLRASQRGSSFNGTDTLEQSRIRDLNMHRVLPLHVFGPPYCYSISDSASGRGSSSSTHPNRLLCGQSTCPSRAPIPL